MRIVICDDEPRLLQDIADRVLGCLPESEIRTFSSGAGLLRFLEDDGCDLLLLDIDMPEPDGLTVAGTLSRLEKRPLLVFVTSHDELVYDSFQYHPFAFLRKSHFDTEIAGVLADCARELDGSRKRFSFRTEGKEVSLLLSDILCFEAEGNYLRLLSRTDSYRFRSTISSVEATLAGCGFLRIHKGFLVNQTAVKLFNSEEAVLSDGTVLPIGKSYAKTAKEQLLRYMRA